MPLNQQNHVFIDPEDCGSSVGYHMHVEEYTDKKTNKTEYTLYATVVLSDCTRKIDWSFNGKDDVLKIDEAIRMLSEFRRKFADTKKMVTRLNKDNQ